MSAGQRDAAANKIVYVRRHGEISGSISMSTARMTDNMIAGHIEGELYTEKSNNGRPLEIEVVADFVALRGQLACQFNH